MNSATSRVTLLKMATLCAIAIAPLAGIERSHLERLLPALVDAEGWSAVAYIDSTGNKTIGYGHKIKKGENLTRVNREEAMALLALDAAMAAESAPRLVKNYYRLTADLRDALIYMEFQLGHSGAMQFVKFRAAIESGDWLSARREIIKEL